MPKVTRQRVNRSRSVKRKSNGNSKGFLQGIGPIEAPTSGIKLTLYGRSGVGKTTFSCTFPKPALLIRCGMDDGTRSVFNVKGVETTPLVKDPDEIDMVVEEQKSSGRWKTIILDTASELQNVILQKVVGLESAPTQLSWGVARQEQWGDVAAGMKDKLKALLSLADDGTNVVIVAQERDFGGEESELAVPTVAQALSPSVVGWLNPACDYVFQCFIREETKTIEKRLKRKVIRRVVKTGKFEYCLRTGVHDVYTVKVRAPKGFKVPDAIVDPDYDKLHKMILGKEI